MGWIDKEKQSEDTIEVKKVLEQTKLAEKPKIKVQSNEELDFSPLSDKEIEDWLFPKEAQYVGKFCAMLYGPDGSGKSGIVLDYLTPEDIKAGYKMLVLDLDGGNLPLLAEYHKDNIKSYIVRNPLSMKIDENGETVIDYQMTINKIKTVSVWVGKNYEKYKIKAVVLDGLSTLLKHAEYLMRSDKHIAADGGVDLRYWIIRARIFTEILEIIKALPIDKFFIAHEDFIAEKDEKMASVKAKANQMVYQKVRCERVDGAEFVEYRATIDKCKTNVLREGAGMVFLKIDKKNQKAQWDGHKVLELMT